MFATIFARTRSLALALLATTALAACGSDGGGVTSPAPVTALQVKNEANVAIVSVYFSGCAEGNWGDDRLGATESIAPGQTRTWTLAAGCWDVKASTANKSGYWYDRTIAAGDTLKLALSSAANE